MWFCQSYVYEQAVHLYLYVEVPYKIVDDIQDYLKLPYMEFVVRNKIRSTTERVYLMPTCPPAHGHILFDGKGICSKPPAVIIIIIN